MSLDYSLMILGLAGFFSIISTIFVHRIKEKVENQTNSIQKQIEAHKQIESLADDLQYEMTKSTIKLANIKDILDKRFVFIDEHRHKDVGHLEPELFLNIDFEHLPEEIKKDPSKYIDVLQALAKYEEFKKGKQKDVMFG